MTQQLTADEIAAKLEAVGGKRWTKDSMDRVYFNGLQDRVSLEITRYNTGNIMGAKHNGEWISNSEGRRALAALDAVKIYYDLTTQKLMVKGSYDDHGWVKDAVSSVQADIATALAD